MSLMSASPSASAKEVSASCFSVGSVVVAAERRTMKIRSGRRDPSAAAWIGFRGTRLTRKSTTSGVAVSKSATARGGRYGSREGEGECHHTHTDQDRRQSHNPEEAHRKTPLPAQLAQVSDPRHADEHHSRDQRNDDHLDRAQEDLAERFDSLGSPQEHRRFGGRGGDSEPYPECQADENGACIHGAPIRSLTGGSALLSD